MINAPCCDKLKVEQLRILSWHGKVQFTVRKPEKKKKNSEFKKNDSLETKSKQGKANNICLCPVLTSAKEHLRDALLKLDN